MRHYIALALVLAAVLTVEACFPAAAGCVTAALVLTNVPAPRTR